jgi:uncharacterized protein DUF4255
MLQLLDATLTAMLSDPASNLDVGNTTDVLFATPDQAFDLSLRLKTINLFLHEVKENRELRDPQPVVKRQANGFVRFEPAIRTMCSYLVTAWSRQAGEIKVTEEHQLLGDTYRWLSRFMTIPNQYLTTGGLTNQLFPPPVMVATLDGNKVFGEFWTALGTPPRPAFLLAVTISVDIRQPTTGYLVTKRNLRVEPGPVKYSGFVMAMTATGQVPLVNASIGLDELQTVSFTGGQFIFPSAGVGTHELAITAPGLQSLRTEVRVPSATESTFVLFPH